MQVDGRAVPSTANFSRLAAAVSAAVLQGGVPAEAAEAAPAAQAAAAAAPASAAVHCPVTGRWSHLGCFPAQFAETLRHAAYTLPCISTQLAATTSQRLAAVCAAGVLPLGSIAEGARAGGAAGGSAAEASSDGDFAPLPLSLLVVRGAAVASPADCRGHSPAYAREQRQQLQVALSAALHVLHRWAACCLALFAGMRSWRHDACQSLQGATCCVATVVLHKANVLLACEASPLPSCLTSALFALLPS